MKFIIILFILSLSANAQDSYIKLKFESEEGDKGSDLLFGIDENASYGVDEELGEYDIISAPPPAGYGIFTLLRFLDSTNYEPPMAIWANKDLIPSPTENIEHIHNFRVWLDGGRKFTITWEIQGNNIDSAKIQDEIGGQFINVDLNNNESYFWDNENVSVLNLRLVVWYNNNIKSVKNIEKKINVYPNPAKDYIFIDYNFESGEIFDIYGRKIKDFYDKNVNTSGLSSGVYFLRIFSGDLVLNKKFVVE
jgi:hypothetical protein